MGRRRIGLVIKRDGAGQMKDFWKQRIGEHMEVVRALHDDEKVLTTLETVSELIVEAYRTGQKLLLCGNGGSAADAQHLAAELVGKFILMRKPLNADALTVNTSTLTAWGNDCSFDDIFSRQVEAKGRRGDVVLAISTSGNSKNIIKAVEMANSMGMVTVGLIGNNVGCPLYAACAHCITVPSSCTPRIQEAHILIGHMLCEYVERKLFSELL